MGADAPAGMTPATGGIGPPAITTPPQVEHGLAHGAAGVVSAARTSATSVAGVASVAGRAAGRARGRATGVARHGAGRAWRATSLARRLAAGRRAAILVTMEQNARRRSLGDGEHPGGDQHRNRQETHGLEHANLLKGKTFFSPSGVRLPNGIRSTNEGNGNFRTVYEGKKGGKHEFRGLGKKSRL